MISRINTRWVVIGNVFLLLASFAWQVFATDEATLAPDQIVQLVINDVAAEMRANEAIYQNDENKLQQMVRERALPYFNFQRMTQLAMARHWREATGEQQAVITREFQTYLVSRYTTILFKYRDVNPEIQLQPGATDQKATIKMKVKNDRGEPVSLYLRLEKSDDRWQLIDVNVEGVSLVITARGRFNEEITQKGMAGFIQAFIEENKAAPHDA